MKKIYLVFILVSLTQITFAQEWSLVGTAFTGIARGLFFNNADTGYAAGAAGVLSKTTDGGSTWTPLTSGVATDLRSVHFVNDTLGYISGASGVFLKTINAGVNWTLSNVGTATLRAVDFTSPDTGLLGGSAGVIYKTTDGGSNWTQINLGITSDIIQLHMHDTNIGYAVGSSGTFTSGYVFKTIDGGTSWNQVFSDPNIGFLGLAVGDSNTVYAGGAAQFIFKTDNGGLTWDTVYVGFAGPNIRSGFGVSEDVAYMVDDFGYVFSTDNGGITWNDTLLTGLYSIYFPTPIIGYTGDGAGNVYKTGGCQPLSTIDSISGPNQVCENDTVVYSVDSIAGANSYTWYLPANTTIIGGNGSNIIIVLFDTTGGNISVVAANECDTVFFALDVTVHLFPAIPTITFSNDTLMSSTQIGYQWYFNETLIPGATDQFYVPTQNGFYTVIVSNAGGCQTSSLPFEVIGLGIDDVTGNSAVEIFPNPLITSTVIFIGGNNDEQFLSISDVQGKIIREVMVKQNTRVTLDRKDFAEGMYFISILNSKHEPLAQSKLLVQ